MFRVTTRLVFGDVSSSSATLVDETGTYTHTIDGGHLMRSAYALIPAALLAGTVLSASPETKASKFEDAEAHTQRWNARQKYFKSHARMRPAKRLLKSAKAQSRKSGDHTSAKPRQLANQEYKIASVTPVTEIAGIAPAKDAIVAQKEDNAALKTVSIAWMSMTKTLRSGPREDGKPVAPVPIAVPQFRIKPNETNNTAYVVDIIRELAPSYGVPTWFALRIAIVESAYDPYARGLVGEIGVYQLKCETARSMGFMGECFQLTDARTNVRWGLKHLSLAIGSSGGDLQLAASKHNGGLGCKSLVQSYIAKVF
jgi:soluble lytic murein transglycosylase-like protein